LHGCRSMNEAEGVGCWGVCVSRIARKIDLFSIETFIPNDDDSMIGDIMPQAYIKAKTFERILELGHINGEDCNKFIDDAILEKGERETAMRKEEANHIDELITED